MNSSMPDETWRIPVPHPCTWTIQDITDADDDDYHNMVNTVQRHTRCSAAYCLRRKPSQQTLKCHFDYPHPQQQVSSLDFELLHDGCIRATITTSRNIYISTCTTASWSSTGEQMLTFRSSLMFRLVPGIWPSMRQKVNQDL